MKVIDSFSFFNEFDILKLRLFYLNNVVDNFVISECKYTHSGEEKPYYLDEIINDLPEDIQNKIIRLKYEPDISDYDFTNKGECNFESGFWKLEQGQRDHISKGLFQFAFGDLFMVSDMDEIPSKELVLYMKDEISKAQFATAKCKNFYYNFNTYEDSNWAGTVFTTIGNALEKGCNYLRRECYSFPFAPDGGWHFTFFGGTEQIQKKLSSYAHQEFNKEEILDLENIKNAILNKKDILQRTHENKNFIEYDFNNFPEDLREVIKSVFSEEFYNNKNKIMNSTESEPMNLIANSTDLPSKRNATPVEPAKPKIINTLEGHINKDGDGGTEIMGRAWQDEVLPSCPELADWNWCIIPGDNIISPDNSNIVWLHPHHEEPNMEQLADPNFQKLFKAFVFVSHWQYENFGRKFNLPMEKCYVLRNAIYPIEPHEKPDSKVIKMIFHPNPIRGLDLMLASLAQIDDPNIELHVYHEIDPDERIRQWEQGFQSYEYSHVCEQEREFLLRCLEMANRDKRVIRHTRSNNSQIREQLKQTHIFAYPTYFMETSCISMIEALAAGCSVVTSNLAALPESSMGFAKHYGFIPDYKGHIDRFVPILKQTIQEYREGKFNSTLQVQQINKEYSWERRVKEWIEFDNIINPK